ncbi:MAG: transglutaminase family protein [Promethearchaeota archaeon]
MSREYLAATRFVDFDKTAVASKAEELVAELDRKDDASRARALFYFVRDEVPYHVPLALPSRRELRASTTLSRRRGFCISKATLLVALGRAVGIPARLHFADIRNHLLSPSLREFMGTDLFVFHGYAEFWLGGKWLKVNPAFDVALARDKGYVPVEFDGNSHAVFQPTDATGNPHIEYVRDRGTFADVPYTEIIQAWFDTYRSAAWAATWADRGSEKRGGVSR